MLEEQGYPSTRSLRKFILYMDRFFDCLNVTNMKNKKGKADLVPYRSGNDPRLEVCVGLSHFYLHHSVCFIDVFRAVCVR